MKSNKKHNLKFFKTFSLIAISVSFYSCISANASEEKKSLDTVSIISKGKRVATKEIKKYWYDGTAEISSFKLKQARYAELHEGTAVLVYVTEPFSKKHNTKADHSSTDNVPILKLNTTKKFNTGIYPYSMMNSTFFPVEGKNNSLKITSSIQEWCGMTYTEMTNNGKNLNFDHHSYFENASFNNKEINIKLLEDDLWSLIRLNPNVLPIGKHQLIPSIFFLKSLHKDFKSYEAIISLEKKNGISNYKIEYPQLSREITISFESSFPYKITGWNETYESGYGKNKKKLTTEATKIKTLKVDYWAKNKNKDKHYREELGLQN